LSLISFELEGASDKQWGDATEIEARERPTITVLQSKLLQ
jgi:hypothetical protein